MLSTVFRLRARAPFLREKQLLCTLSEPSLHLSRPTLALALSAPRQHACIPADRRPQTTRLPCPLSHALLLCQQLRHASPPPVLPPPLTHTAQTSDPTLAKRARSSSPASVPCPRDLAVSSAILPWQSLKAISLLLLLSLRATVTYPRALQRRRNAVARRRRHPWRRGASDPQQRSAAVRERHVRPWPHCEKL